MNSGRLARKYYELRKKKNNCFQIVDKKEIRLLKYNFKYTLNNKIKNANKIEWKERLDDEITGTDVSNRRKYGGLPR